MNYVLQAPVKTCCSAAKNCCKEPLQPLYGRVYDTLWACCKEPLQCCTALQHVLIPIFCIVLRSAAEYVLQSASVPLR